MRTNVRQPRQVMSETILLSSTLQGFDVGVGQIVKDVGNGRWPERNNPWLQPIRGAPL
jgi:hypothetical protein